MKNLKIFQGEIEIGTENGVSVYPAFKTSEGDIVLGLNLPITKTTLYTQQHLIEYDDRPCYLVRGDYVGKDTDGQPLINNVNIIEKIDTYRIKEKKQGEHKLALSEEDEERIKNILSVLDVQVCWDGATGKKVNPYQKEISWLKSFKERAQPKQEWNEEDEEALEEVQINFEINKGKMTPALQECYYRFFDKIKTLNTYLKKEWSEEDKEFINDLIGIFDGQQYQAHSDEEIVNWLKSLKDRVQPKQEWNEDDEKIILAISQLLKDCESENGWNCVYSNDREVFFADIENYLQSFKTKIAPQPKHEWSEKDDDFLMILLPFLKIQKRIRPC